MNKTWLDEIEARLDAVDDEWELDEDEADNAVYSKANSGLVAMVAPYANVRTTMARGEDWNRADQRLIANAPADLRRLLRVARAAEAARERIGDVAIAPGVFAEHGSGPEGQRVLSGVWRALDALDNALSGEETT